jgi:hypothetical protein
VVLPRAGRRRQLRRLEQALGLPLLRPNDQMVMLGVAGLLAALFTAFPAPLPGILAAAGSVLWLRLAYHLGRELLPDATVGQLAQQLAAERYTWVRGAQSVNRRELPRLLRQLFADQLALEPSALHRDASFG